MLDLIKLKLLGLIDIDWRIAFLPLIIWLVVLLIMAIYYLIKYRDLL